MLIYLAGPYSNVVDKHAYIEMLMTVSGNYMVANPGHHIVSPLFFHYAIDKVDKMEGDWKFWKNYSIDLLRRCDVMYCLDGKLTDRSEGVNAELDLALELNIPFRWWHAPDGKTLVFVDE